MRDEKILVLYEDNATVDVYEHEEMRINKVLLEYIEVLLEYVDEKYRLIVEIEEDKEIIIDKIKRFENLLLDYDYDVEELLRLLEDKIVVYRLAVERKHFNTHPTDENPNCIAYAYILKVKTDGKVIS